jgi:hypothetical protein
MHLEKLFSKQIKTKKNKQQKENEKRCTVCWKKKQKSFQIKNKIDSIGFGCSFVFVRIGRDELRLLMPKNYNII